jgi:putative membrane protein
MEGFWLYWLFGALILLGILIIIGVVVVWPKEGQPRAQGSARPGNSEKGHARAILDERYARGELTSEEYRQRLMGLKENR